MRSLTKMLARAQTDSSQKRVQSGSIEPPSSTIDRRVELGLRRGPVGQESARLTEVGLRCGALAHVGDLEVLVADDTMRANRAEGGFVRVVEAPSPYLAVQFGDFLHRALVVGGTVPGLPHANPAWREAPSRRGGVATRKARRSEEGAGGGAGVFSRSQQGLSRWAALPSEHDETRARERATNRRHPPAGNGSCSAGSGTRPTARSRSCRPAS